MCHRNPLEQIDKTTGVRFERSFVGNMAKTNYNPIKQWLKCVEQLEEKPLMDPVAKLIEILEVYKLCSIQFVTKVGLKEILATAIRNQDQNLLQLMGWYAKHMKLPSLMFRPFFERQLMNSPMFFYEWSIALQRRQMYGEAKEVVLSGLNVNKTDSLLELLSDVLEGYRPGPTIPDADNVRGLGPGIAQSMLALFKRVLSNANSKEDSLSQASIDELRPLGCMTEADFDNGRIELTGQLTSGSSNELLNEVSSKDSKKDDAYPKQDGLNQAPTDESRLVECMIEVKSNNGHEDLISVSSDEFPKEVLSEESNNDDLGQAPTDDERLIGCVTEVETSTSDSSDYDPSSDCSSEMVSEGSDWCDEQDSMSDREADKPHLVATAIESEPSPKKYRGRPLTFGRHSDFAVHYPILRSTKKTSKCNGCGQEFVNENTFKPRVYFYHCIKECPKYHKYSEYDISSF